MQTSSKIPVLIAVDQLLVREGLASVLNRHKSFEVVAQTGKQSEVMSHFVKYRPSVLILDLRLEGVDTIETIKKVRDTYPAAAILVISDSDGSEDIYRALRSGARGYVLKDTSDTELLEAIQAISSGRRYIPPAIATRLAERMTDRL